MYVSLSLLSIVFDDDINEGGILVLCSPVRIQAYLCHKTSAAEDGRYRST